MPSKKLHFVLVSGQGGRASADTRKDARAHAAREAHAKERRQRMQHFLQTEEADGTIPRYHKVTELPTPLDMLASHHTDPFSATVKPLTPREKLLLRHYVVAVVPGYGQICPVLARVPNLEESIHREWVRLAVTDLGLLCSLFLSASRHMMFRQGSRNEFVPGMFTQYKLVCLQQLRQAIAVEAQLAYFSMATIAKAFALAFEEMAMGDVVSCNNHLDGIVKMINTNGGPRLLGNTIIEHLYNGFIVGRPTGAPLW